MSSWPADRVDTAMWTDRRLFVSAIVVSQVVLASLFSLAVTGFHVGEENNFFHLIILKALWREPQFATDAFIQSMRYFDSGFWLLHIGAANDRDALDFFLPWMLVSRLLLFTGIMMWAGLLGLKGWRQTSIFLLLACTSAVLRNESFAGDGGLMIRTFTHSELNNGLALIALALTWRGRLAWALAIAGLVFFINIFMAVWLVPMMLVLVAIHMRRGQLNAGALIRQCWPGLLVCIVLAVPVLNNLLHNPDLGRKLDFDYRVFLNEYWPFHFIAWSFSLSDWIGFAIVISLAIGSAMQLPREGRELVLAMTAVLLGLWVVGAFLPLFTASPLLFDLHLLRSSEYIQLIGGMALAAFTTQLLTGEDAADRRYWGPSLVLLSVVKAFALILFVPILLLRQSWHPAGGKVKPAVGYALLAISIAGVGGKVVKEIKDQGAFLSARGNWLQLSEWAKTKTAPDTIFLLPTDKLYTRSPLPRAPGRMDDLMRGIEVFSSYSHRQVWVTGKQGAAVMWTPSYYHTWHDRLVGALNARDLADRIAYARTNGIGVVVDDCAVKGTFTPVFSAGRLCVFDAR